MEYRDQTSAFRALMAAVIECALSDLKGEGIKCGVKDKDYAMSFFLSETCETYCIENKIDYDMIKETAIKYYQEFIAKFDHIPERKKYARKPEKHFGRVMTRLDHKKRRITSDRQVIGQF